MKRCIILLLALIFVFSAFPISTFAVEIGIMDELQSATIDGKKFDITNYPKVAGGQAELLAFQEYGYTVSGPSVTFKLFLYVYNKSERKINTDGESSITIATGFDEKGNAKTYSKFKLIFIEASADNRFLKFEVGISPSSTIVSSRKYQISEFEVHYAGNANATASTVGSVFKFSGYSKDNNLTTERQNIKTIKREVAYTYFRTQTSDAGEGHQNQLNSVYFTVPNELLESEGFLSRIKIAYRKQRTAPIFVTDDDEVYAEMSKYIGVNIGEKNDNVPFYLYSSSSVGVNSDIRPYGYNYDGKLGIFSVSHIQDHIPLIPYVFKTDSYEPESITVKSWNLLSYIQKYNKADWLFEDGYDEKLTIQDIDCEDQFELTSYSDSLNAFDRWLYSKIFKGLTEESYKDLKPFYYITATDVALPLEEMARELCISEDAAFTIRSNYASAAAKDETIVIFRYAETDYFTHNMQYGDGGLTTKSLYFAQEDIYFDWDMIELEFELDGEKTVMPFVMSPQDQAGDITDPVDPPSNDSKFPSLFGDSKDGEVPDFSWIVTCLGLLLGIVALFFVCKFLDVFDSVIDIFDRRSQNKNRRDKS